MTGSYVQVQGGISNSFRVWCLHMGWILSWASHFILCSIFVLAFPLDRKNSESRNLKLVGWPHISNRGHVYLKVVSLGSTIGHFNQDYPHCVLGVYHKPGI